MPRPGETKEWVRLGFATAVVATSVEVYETFSPGSVAAIRLADATDETGTWVEVWRAPTASRTRRRRRCAAASRRRSARRRRRSSRAPWRSSSTLRGGAGAPPPPLKEGALGAFMGKQPWESERAHAARAQAAQRAMPAGASAESDDAQMRRAALDGVGEREAPRLRYPAEAAAGVRRAGAALSGYAVESALRAAE